MGNGSSGAAPGEDAGPASPGGISRRVLVVDDSRPVLEALTQLLTEVGCQVERAAEGQEALQQVQRFRPHVVLCDVQLSGGLSGYDVARRVRALNLEPRPLLVAMTAYVREELPTPPEEAGFDRLLGKPFDVDVLQQLVLGTPPVD